MNIKHLNYGINSIDNLKKTYRKKCFEMHPDKGGRVDEMQELNSEYNWIKENFYEYTTDIEAASIAIRLIPITMGELFMFKNIQVEFIDNCIWITGKTFDIKERLKKCGFKFSANNKAWYWTKYGYYNGSNIDLAQLKIKYNSIKIL